VAGSLDSKSPESGIYLLQVKENGYKMQALEKQVQYLYSRFTRLLAKTGYVVKIFKLHIEQKDSTVQDPDREMVYHALTGLARATSEADMPANTCEEAVITRPVLHIRHYRHFA
jgi:hypothetical protein